MNTEIMWKAGHLVKKGLNFLYANRAIVATGVSAVGKVVGTVLLVKKAFEIAPVIEEYKKTRADIPADDKKAIRTSVVNEAMFMVREFAVPGAILVGCQALDIYSCATLTHTTNVLAAALAAETAVNNNIIKAVKANESETDEEKKVPVVTDRPSIYAQLFDETCGMWKKCSPLERQVYIYYAVEKLNATLIHDKPHKVFLNDAYREIEGKWVNQVGQFAGWPYDPEHPWWDDKEKDAPIQIRFYEKGTLEPIDSKDLDNGIDRPVWIDFNIPGNAMNYLPEY